MPFDFSLPLLATSGLVLVAIVTYFGWPHLRVRTYNKTHGDLRVVEIAFMLSRSARPFLPAAQSNHGKSTGRVPGAEFVIYMTLKTGNL
ncbi:MAG TPA: hypothetical protein VKP67_14795 [Xanthobacteraceae bacterium]|nr:hypothetical protein [Xanthobacteraceae bacterium]